jgi:hypothetical protein
VTRKVRYPSQSGKDRQYYPLLKLIHPRMTEILQGCTSPAFSEPNDTAKPASTIVASLRLATRSRRNYYTSLLYACLSRQRSAQIVFQVRPDTVKEGNTLTCSFGYPVLGLFVDRLAPRYRVP